MIGNYACIAYLYISRDGQILEFWTLGLIAGMIFLLALLLWWAQMRNALLARVEELTAEAASARGEAEAVTSEFTLLRGQKDADSEQMRFFCDFVRQFNGQMSFAEGVSTALETLWQLPEIDAAALVIGEDELGPFHYRGIRGAADPFAIVGTECPLPLWGTLARTIVHRPEAGELDCVCIADIGKESKPLPEEFPWLPRSGSLLLLPLRGRDRTMGAVILHSQTLGSFQDLSRRRFLYALVGFLSRSLHELRIQEQSVRWDRHLVSLQLLTRTMTAIDSVEGILNILHEESTDMFGRVAVHLFLRQAGNRQSEADFSLYAGPHISRQEEQLVRSQSFSRLLSWVMEAEQPLFIDPQTSLHSPEAVYYQESGHGILVPIFGSIDTAGGVLLLMAPPEARPFDENDLIVIRTIANSASVAIGNRMLGQMVHSTPV